MKKLWGARFKRNSDKLADQLTFSISTDYRLAKYDCLGSMAHARMLGKQRIIPKMDAQTIVAGLSKILLQIQSGKFKVDPEAEDVHTNIQNALKNLIGPPADKLHTARSRNDQVVLDVKLYCRYEVGAIILAAAGLQQSIVQFAKKNTGTIIPGYTHLQQAQVVLLGHHMLAYVEMLERDKQRLSDCLKRLDVLPLGSCALAGTSLKTDRKYLAKLLRFSAVSPNSMDAVSDRDFIAEVIFDCAMMAVHISRICEDLILWASREFHFVDIDWAMCTGSSIMPQKKNPDVLELLRGSTAKMIAHVTEILTLPKGLPLTYNRDLQLDKPPLFDAVDTSKMGLQLLAKVFAGLKVHKQQVAASLTDESFYCVDAMEYLIRKGVSYREAHDILGAMVKDCLDQGKKITALTTNELKAYAPQFAEDVKNLFNPQMSVKIKNSFGSTNPGLVARQMDIWSKKLHA